jgi:hypothetical protein
MDPREKAPPYKGIQETQDTHPLCARKLFRQNLRVYARQNNKRHRPIDREQKERVEDTLPKFRNAKNIPERLNEVFHD